MKQSLFTCVVVFLEYIRPAHAGSQMVWLKDVTTGFATDKRTPGDFDLPNELTFHLKRGSDALTLNLKRNYDINPDADVYFAHRLDDGRFQLVKTPNLEKMDRAYYQDMENGAYMIVRCVKRENDRCNRVINGNIRIGDRGYDLSPAGEEVTSRIILDVLGHLGKRYVLQDQADLHIINSLESKEQSAVNKKKTYEELSAHAELLHGQHKQNQFLDFHSMTSSRNVAVFPNRLPVDKARQLKKNYFVDVAVLIDPGLWDSYSWTVSALNPGEKVEKVKEKIREAYSQVINGEGAIQHTYSNVTKVNGIKYIEALSYLKDLFIWDTKVGDKELPKFDEAILFTDLNLYKDTIRDNAVHGISFRTRICETGGRTAVVEESHYVQTVSSAAHELGHSLGAWHDGEGTAEPCDPKDYFIMTPLPKPSGPSLSYSRNPWRFSHCSVDSFKATLTHKDCVTTKGMVYSLSDWRKYMMKQPAQVYTPNEQCRLMNGPNSVNCGDIIKRAAHR